MALVMQQKKNLTAAERLFRTVVQLARETDEVPSKELSDRMGGLASVLIQDGRVEEGKRMLDEALNMDDMLGRLEGMTKKLGSLSEAALKVNDIEGALTYCAMSEKQGHGSALDLVFWLSQSSSKAPGQGT